jgi:hypothetical protein
VGSLLALLEKEVEMVGDGWRCSKKMGI